jgi:hypothetical protein
MRLFEFFFVILFSCYSFEGHSNAVFSVFLEVQESVWVLKLVQISLNVLVVVNVLHQLCLPLSALLVVHELLAVQVVEKYSYFGLVLVSEVKPKFFDLNSFVIHIFS